MNIKIEPMCKSKLVQLQISAKNDSCMDIQGGKCHRQSRYVKCAGKHLTSKCIKINKLNCMNCDEEHPDSYRECTT